MPSPEISFWLPMLFAGGVILQLCAFFAHQAFPVLFISGAVCVASAALLERDITLLVGQIAVVCIVLWTRRADAQ